MMPSTQNVTIKTTEVAKLIFAFGLLSELSGLKRIWTGTYQFAVSLFVLLNGIRFAALFWVPAGSIWGLYLGDFAFFMAAEERDLLLFLMVLASCFWLHSAFFIFQEWINCGKKMSWLEMMKTCALESFDFSGIGLCRKDSIRFRKRVWLTTRLCLVYVVSMAFVGSVFSVYVVAVNYPIDYRLTVGILHGVNFTFTCIYWICFGYGMLFFFYQLTFYFQLRFDHVHSRLLLLKAKDSVRVKNGLLPELKTLHSILDLVFEFNNFWKYILAIDYGILLLLISLLSYFGFFSEINWMYRVICGFSATMVFVLLCVVSVSAALVSKRVSLLVIVFLFRNYYSNKQISQYKK